MDSSQSTVTPRRSQRHIQMVNEATPELSVEAKRVPGPRSMARANKKAKLLNQTAPEMTTTTTSDFKFTDPEEKNDQKNKSNVNIKSTAAEADASEHVDVEPPAEKAKVHVKKQSGKAKKRGRSAKKSSTTSDESSPKSHEPVKTSQKSEVAEPVLEVTKETVYTVKVIDAIEPVVHSVKAGVEALTPVVIVTQAAGETPHQGIFKKVKVMNSAEIAQVETAFDLLAAEAIEEQEQAPENAVTIFETPVKAPEIPPVFAETPVEAPELAPIVAETPETAPITTKAPIEAPIIVPVVAEAPIEAPQKQAESSPELLSSDASPEKESDFQGSLISATNDDVFMSAESEEPNETLLDDESVISIDESLVHPESPKVAASPPRDSTFSPIVDASIHDYRPNIDLEAVAVAKPLFNRPAVEFGNNFEDDSPVLGPAKLSIQAVSLRTSTPYANRLAQKPNAVTPKRSASNTPMFRAKTPKLIVEEPIAEKLKINPLEKSILKSSRRKRSMSVADCESFAQKRVMFISPKVMDIGEIDEKMMASFIEEKENSMMRQAAASGTRRKRSLSTGTPAKKQDSAQKIQPRAKLPNFKAIHEQQFQKMESIAEHAARKAERAQKLATHVKDGEKKKSVTEPDDKRAKPMLSKIPTRKVLASSTDNLSTIRTLKRSLSNNNDEPPREKQTFTKVAEATSASKPLADGPSTSKARKIGVVSGLQRSFSEQVKQAPSWVAPASSSSIMGDLKKKLMSSQYSASQSVAQQNRAKIEERRERNMSLYKTKQVNRTVDQRSKNTEMLKGVRLNRRFELQMQHRRDNNV